MGCPNFTAAGLPEAGLGTRDLAEARRTPPVPLARLLMQAQGSQQVSPQSALRGAEAAVCFAGVAQSVEHLFCKQVVRGSSPRASSHRQRVLTGTVSVPVSKVSESCPSGQREQAVNLPAYAYAGSNPALSTSARRRRASVSVICLRERSSRPAEVNSAGPHPQVLGPLPQNTANVRLGTIRALGRSRSPASFSAGVAQLVERQPSKLNVEGSSPFSRSVVGAQAQLIASHAEVTETHAHLAQLVEHVLGKDEVTSSILVVGSKR